MRLKQDSDTSTEGFRLSRRLASVSAVRIQELSVVLGLIKEAGPDYVTPPQWVIVAVNEIVTGRLRYLSQFKDKNEADLTKAQRGKIQGMIDGFMFALNRPSGRDLAAEDTQPAIKACRLGFAAVASRYEASLKVRCRTWDSEAKGFKAGEKAQFQLGYHEGFKRVLDENGQVREDDTMTTELLFAMWWFWPELKFLHSVSEILAWLRELSPTPFGRKLVESVCTKIGFFESNSKNVPLGS